MDQIQEVDARALSVIEEANLVSIVNHGTYAKAGVLWKSIKDMRKQVKNTFSPIITKAHQAHKEAIAQRDKIMVPLTKTGKTVKYAMEKYDSIQEEMRKKKEAKLREIARKEEEERQLAEALEAEQNGEKEEAETILEAPAYVPPVVVAKTTPKLQGGPVYRTVWKFRIIDKRKVPNEFLIPDQVKIGQIVRAMKEATNIPGVEAYSERV